MSIQLNHSIVWCRDKSRSAAFLTEVLGLPPPTAFGPFLVVQVDNAVSLDFHDTAGAIAPQHYAFLVSDAEFDPIFARMKAKVERYWADPGKHRAGEINYHDGGRGVYFDDPDGHLLEVITRPYGGDPA